MLKVQVEIILDNETNNPDDDFLSRLGKTFRREVPRELHLSISDITHGDFPDVRAQNWLSHFGRTEFQNESPEWWQCVMRYIRDKCEASVAVAVLETVKRGIQCADHYEGGEHRRQIEDLELEVKDKKARRDERDITRKRGPHTQDEFFWHRLLEAIGEIAGKMKLRPTQQAVAEKMGYASAGVLRQMMKRHGKDADSLRTRPENHLLRANRRSMRSIMAR